MDDDRPGDAPPPGTDAAEAEHQDVEPEDLIVGTIHAPAWLGRMPLAAWLFVALAVADVAYRTRGLWLNADSSQTLPSFSVLVGAIPGWTIGAATVLLPAAMLMSRGRLGRAQTWLIQGAVALAAAEVVDQFGGPAIDAIAGWLWPSQNLVLGPLPGDFYFGGTDIPIFWIRSLIVWAIASLVTVAGLANIGLGLKEAQEPEQRLGRRRFAVLACVVAAVTVGGVIVLPWSTNGPAETFFSTRNALSIVVGVVTVSLWAWIASVAACRHGRSWGWIVAGGLAAVAGWCLGSLAWPVVFLLSGGDSIGGQEALFRLYNAANLLDAIGLVLLLVAFSRGFDLTDDADDDHAEWDDVDQDEPKIDEASVRASEPDLAGA